MIIMRELAIGSGGGVACRRCAGAVAESHRSADAIVSDIRRGCADGGSAMQGIVFTGAEPFRHPELPRLVASAISAGCRRLALDTEGVALRSPANAHGVIGAGVRHLRFTLLGGSPGVHDALIAVPGRLEETLAGVRAFRDAAADSVPVSVVAVVPVCRHNHRDLPAAVAVAVRAGVDSVLIRVEDGGLDLSSLIPWMTSACDTGVVNSVWVEVEGMPFCMLQGYELHSSDVVRQRDGSKSPACHDCGLDPFCSGACRTASADQLTALACPSGAASLATRVGLARSGTAS